jgi:uncharacterized membrane protein YjgN (DUF898 family)
MVIFTMSKQIYQVAYTGRCKTLMGLYFKLMFKTIFTLGFYLPWARTQVRQYIVQNITINNEPLHYTGTPRQLFVGMMYGGLVMLAVFLGGLLLTNVASEGVGTIFSNLMPWLIGGAGSYAALRYQTAHVYYRHLNGHLRGSAWHYAFYTLACDIASVLTLGLFVPHFDIMRQRCLLRHLSIGNTPVTFTPKASVLYKVHLITWVIAVPFVLVGVSAFGDKFHPLVLVALIGLLPRLWYFIYRTNYFLSVGRAGSMQFKGDYTVAGLFELMLSAVMCIIFTLFIFAFVVGVQFLLLPLYKSNLAIQLGLIIACVLLSTPVWAALRHLTLKFKWNNIRMRGNLDELPPAAPQPEEKYGEVLYGVGYQSGATIGFL